jgi:hypothetical protein
MFVLLHDQLCHIEEKKEGGRKVYNWPFDLYKKNRITFFFFGYGRQISFD